MRTQGVGTIVLLGHASATWGVSFIAFMSELGDRPRAANVGDTLTLISRPAQDGRSGCCSEPAFRRQPPSFCCRG